VSVISSDRRDAAYRDQPSLFDPPMVATAPVQPVASGLSGKLEDHGKASRNETYHEVKGDHANDRMIWLCRIVAKGVGGATLDELAAEFGVEASSFSGRITELKNLGLVVHTAERRRTRKGSTASVIVAVDFLKSGEKREASNQKGNAVSTGYMPDQLTCTSTPLDQYGDPIRDGGIYIVNKTKVQCFESEGSLFIQKIVRRDVPAVGSSPQLVGELPASVKIERV
jgi:hypothetical protein